MSLVAYTARWLIDGVRDEPIENGVIVVEGSRIVEAREGSPPSSADVIELGDATLLPGLIDCHVHLPFDASADPVAAFKRLTIPRATLAGYIHAQALLRKGVTTVRDVSTPFGISIALRDAINAGDLVGPTIVAAGAHLCITGGHASSIGVEVDGPEEVRKAVREQLKAGADLIKVMGTGGVYSMGNREAPEDVQFELDELCAATDVAHRNGRRIAVHAEGAEGIRLALEAEIDTIEHGNMLDADLAKRMAEQGTFLVPTVGAFASSSKRRDAPAEYISNASRMADGSAKALRYARLNQVRVACGTDRGTVSYMPWDGEALFQEMRFMVELGGYDVLETIHSATAVGAEALGIESSRGTLRAGLAADFVATAGCLLDDLSSVRNPALVVKNGAVVLREYPVSA